MKKNEFSDILYYRNLWGSDDLFKEIAKCIGKYKKETVLTPLTVSMEVIIEVIIPFMMANIIDKGIEAKNMRYIAVTGGILAFLTVLSLVFGALAGKYAAVASAGFAKNLRKKMYYKIQDFSFSNIDKFSTSSLVTRLTTDVSNLQNAFQMIIRIAVRSPLMLVFSLIMAAKIGGRLSLVLLCIVPVLAIGLSLIIKNAHPLFVKVFKTYDELNRVTRENLRGIRVVKAFVRENYETKKFNDVSNDIFRLFRKAERILAFNAPIMQFSVYLCTILLSWFGAKIIVTTNQTALTTGQLTGLISYTMQILASLMMVSMIFVMLTLSKASADRIAEVLKEESTLKDCEKPVFEVKDGSISFENVVFGYNETNPCLKNINLEIKSGETIGIVGGTGSAKSTLVQLIPRLYDVNSGCVKVGGVDVRKYDIKSLREQVSVVLQKNVLFSGTIKENLRWGNKEATDEEMINACKLAQADGFIQTFPNKYDTYIEQGGANVSGGQKQRLCIARALLKKPKILILDDSTSAVDTATDALIRKAFREEIPDTTKLIIAQRITSVMESDKIIVMENGEINGFGTHDELLKNNVIYREVYESQMKDGEE